MPEQDTATEPVTHSPAPWTFEPIPPAAFSDPDMRIDEDSKFWIVDSHAAEEVIATVIGTQHGQALANARVLSAAPAMLIALKQCRDALNDYTDDRPGFPFSMPYLASRAGELLAVVDAALDKAEGR